MLGRTNKVLKNSVEKVGKVKTSIFGRESRNINRGPRPMKTYLSCGAFMVMVYFESDSGFKLRMRCNFLGISTSKLTFVYKKQLLINFQLNILVG